MIHSDQDKLVAFAVQPGVSDRCLSFYNAPQRVLLMLPMTISSRLLRRCMSMSMKLPSLSAAMPVGKLHVHVYLHKHRLAGRHSTIWLCGCGQTQDEMLFLAAMSQDKRKLRRLQGCSVLRMPAPHNHSCIHNLGSASQLSAGHVAQAYWMTLWEALPGTEKI